MAVLYSLIDVEVYLTKKEAEEFLWNLRCFKEQEEHSPIDVDYEAIIDGDVIDGIVQECIELWHKKT